MLYAVHCDFLVLGVGETAAIAEADAVAHGADLDDTATCLITPEAASYVSGGGDCRLLWISEDANGEDRFTLRSA